MIKFEEVKLTIQEGVATVQLNRPKKKNCMSPTMHRNMNDALTEIEKAKDVKVVVITGVKDSFCAGMDLEKTFLEAFGDSEKFNEINESALNWFKRLKAFPAVTVAKVNGWCFGGGFLVATACDIVITSDDAVWGLSEVNFGMIPGGGVSWAYAHHFPRSQGLYYALTGETIKGSEAVALGLAAKSVPADQLDAETKKIVDNLKNKNRQTLVYIKKVYEQSLRMNLPDSIDWEMAMVTSLAQQSGNAWINDGISQFKRKEYRPGLESYRLKEGQ